MDWVTVGAVGEEMALRSERTGGGWRTIWPKVMRWPAGAQRVGSRRVKFSSRYTSWGGISVGPSMKSSTMKPGWIPEFDLLAA